MNKLSFMDQFHIWRRKIRWNRQYKKGRWDYLKNDVEAPRYAKIIASIKQYATKQPSILDLGSGEGILRMRLEDEGIGYFLGIDFSKVSIKTASNYDFENADFQVADLHYYKPPQEFDVIVFNEAFYYINHSVRTKVINRILAKLKKDGILITSIFKEGPGCWKYFEIPELEQLEFSKVDSEKGTAYWKLGVYKKT
ncbi:class I SAM-dependent methyltransferase [Flavobacteriaceae bacterium]|jgi:SAM-dependent methyltransferase|nr:class I SAM-dependent methyltransferase [Flavobacteriaceae bacterium]MDA7724420.1 class I SAM-dependent methyltransferase [Flavobacteriaceae bacterium]MDA7849001.1 class I SAM-dependent methyltransferase [Flavobacteriaceae bacterium]MDG1309733.1 class I SAM-dependent methyltransferase [Flavobacteriaceae bacterium]|tara:strand:- start:1227 stop:1814 length:588 start_codon:yes stop_codon:yes gene_type:complete